MAQLQRMPGLSLQTVVQEVAKEWLPAARPYQGRHVTIPVQECGPQVDWPRK